jgi:hypothetical protein
VPPRRHAIILPTVLAQDALTVWTYRRDWARNLRIMIPSIARDRRRRIVRGLAHRRPCPAGDQAHRQAFVLQHWLGGASGAAARC